MKSLLLFMNAWTKKSISWLLPLSVFLGGVFGCGRFETDESGLVVPAAEVAHRSNFQAGALASDRFEWSRGQQGFCVNIPEAGDYLVSYATTKIATSLAPVMTAPTTPQTLTFTIVLRANAPAYVSIGLEEDETLTRVVVRRGAIWSEAVGLYDDGPIIRYASPSIPTIFWKDVFTPVPDVRPIDLIRGVLPCSSPMFSELELR